ncbi:hypothetical protein MD484_g3252, partial [Candolleomyces efflorescens]
MSSSQQTSSPVFVDPTITPKERSDAGPALYSVNERVKVLKDYVGVDFTVHVDSEPLVRAVYLKRGASWNPQVQWAYNLLLIDGSEVRGVPEDHLVPI